jgi:hypothetical protein
MQAPPSVGPAHHKEGEIRFSVPDLYRLSGASGRQLHTTIFDAVQRRGEDSSKSGETLRSTLEFGSTADTLNSASPDRTGVDQHD